MDGWKDNLQSIVDFRSMTIFTGIRTAINISVFCGSFCCTTILCILVMPENRPNDFAQVVQLLCRSERLIGIFLLRDVFGGTEAKFIIGKDSLPLLGSVLICNTLDKRG